MNTNRKAMFSTSYIFQKHEIVTFFAATLRVEKKNIFCKKKITFFSPLPIFRGFSFGYGSPWARARARARALARGRVQGRFFLIPAGGVKKVKIKKYT